MIRYFKYIAESTDLLNRTNRSELDIFFRMSKTDQELFERLIDHFSSVLCSIIGKENMNDRILKIIYELSALKAYDIIKEEEDIK